MRGDDAGVEQLDEATDETDPERKVLRDASDLLTDRYLELLQEKSGDFKSSYSYTGHVSAYDSKFVGLFKRSNGDLTQSEKIDCVDVCPSRSILIILIPFCCIVR